MCFLGVRSVEAFSQFRQIFIQGCLAVATSDTKKPNKTSFCGYAYTGTLKIIALWQGRREGQGRGVIFKLVLYKIFLICSILVKLCGTSFAGKAIRSLLENCVDVYDLDLVVYRNYSAGCIDYFFACLYTRLLSC